MRLQLSPEAPEWQLCLHFANTVAWHASTHPKDGLSSYEALLAWSRRREVLDALEEARLLEAAALEPERAAAVLARAMALREAIYRIFSARAQERPCAAQDLEVLNEALGEALAQARVVPAGGGYSWGWADGVDLERPLWPVSRSAAILLTSNELLERVGECADDRGCGWLFLDLSKNRSRRWCDINDCGNRAKQRRHVQRVRARTSRISDNSGGP